MSEEVVKIVLFRHGQTEWNQLGRWQGQTDIPLNDTGKNQARDFAERYRHSGISLIVSSDLKRAYNTAQPLAAKIPCELIKSPMLRETSFGDAEGMTTSQIKEKFGIDFFNRWKSNEQDPEHCFPNGESRKQVLERAYSGLRGILKERADCRCLGVSTHGGLLRVFLNSIGHAEAGKHGPLPHCTPFFAEYLPSKDEFRLSTKT